MADLFFIQNCGCDDETIGLARMTDEQLSFFKTTIEDLNKNSTYGCMPKIYVYRIDENMIREAEDDDPEANIMYLGDCRCVLEDGLRWQIVNDEFEARRIV